MDAGDLLSRREFIGAAAAGVVGIAAGGSDASAPEVTAYVGTYTHDGPSKGIYVVRMATDTGALRLDGVAATTADPSFLALHPSGRFVYAVNELTDFGGQPSGAVTAFARHSGSRRLAALNQQASRGGAPCYITVDRAGRFALVANYVGGSVAVLPIHADGSLGATTTVIQHHGSGPNAERQEAPHVHSVTLDPANRFALVADLGTDHVHVYGFDARTGALTEAGPPVAAHAGAGPRHLAFHPNGRLVYVVNELDSTVTGYRYDGARGALTALATVPMLPPNAPTGSAAVNSAADIHVSPSGRHLYASNRGYDTVAVFAVDETTGALTRVQLVDSGGKGPRNFALDPRGRFLLAANQRSDVIVAFRVDRATGRLTPTGHQLAVPAPVCVRFVPSA